MNQANIYHGGGKWKGTFSSDGGGSGADELVKRSGADTTAGFLSSKILQGEGIQFTLNNPGGNESFDIVDIGIIKVSGADTLSNYLDSKLVVSTGLSKAILNPGGDEDLQLTNTVSNTDNFVKVSASDTLENFLDQKIEVADGIIKTILNPGGNEDLEFGYDNNAKVSVADTTRGYLDGKIVVDATMTKTVLNPGGSETLELSSLVGGPVLLQTNFQYNDSDSLSLNDRFIAYKVISKFSFVADEMGCFIFDTNDDKEFELGIYNESGVRIARIGQKVLGDYVHEEVQFELQDEIELEKGNQYWLGIWGNGIDIGTEVGFANLGTVFPGRIHCIDESSEPSLPADISTFNPGVQQVAIWARGFM